VGFRASTQVLTCSTRAQMEFTSSLLFEGFLLESFLCTDRDFAKVFVFTTEPFWLPTDTVQ